MYITQTTFIINKDIEGNSRVVACIAQWVAVKVMLFKDYAIKKN